LINASGRGRPRVSLLWTGWVLILTGLLVAIGSFMTWATVYEDGVEIGSFAGTDGNRDGKITAVLGALILALGVVIVAKQGRLWVGIVGIVLAAFGAITALADIGDISNTSRAFGGLARLDVGPGLIVVLVASLAALGVAITALCIRRVL
jgi:hypothetical protein